jgi:hypothetical protein
LLCGSLPATVMIPNTSWPQGPTGWAVAPAKKTLRRSRSMKVDRLGGLVHEYRVAA